jgi:ABC-type nickel/cobalt efflux system permease component RcnA
VSRAGRRLAATLALSAAVFGLTALVGAPAALAHPLGNFTVNHASEITISPGYARIVYALDMAEIPTFQERSAIDASHDGSISRAESAAWARAEAGRLGPLLALTASGRTVDLTDRCGATAVLRRGQGGLPVLRMVAVFDAAIPDAGTLRFEDRTFAGRIGWKEVTLSASAGGGVRVSRSDVPSVSPSDHLRRYPANLLQSPLAVTRASADYAEAGPAASSGGASRPMPCPGVAAAVPASTASGSAFASLVTRRLTPAVLAVSLLLAFVFGVMHALGPGHGKTVTAAYLVGAGARVRQAVGVGVAVASMHTFSVLALGVIAVALSASFPAERIYPWLTFVTGAVAVVLGSVLLALRIRALRTGHGFHGHRHDHGDQSLGHDHGDGRHVHEDDTAPAGSVSRPRLMALAVSGGMLPSPTALVVLLASIAAHRVVYGLALIGVFSAGLAAALVAISLVALRARSVVDRRLGVRAAAIVPVVSALVIVGFGLFFVARGLMQAAA